MESGIVNNCNGISRKFCLGCQRYADGTIQERFAFRPSLKKDIHDVVINCNDFINEIKPIQTDAINPSHYKRYSVEVIDMMVKIFGSEKVAAYCEINAFKYRMRMGTKQGNNFEQDLKKEEWYVTKTKDLINGK